MTVCIVCGAPGYLGAFEYCQPCGERAADEARVEHACPDCASRVDVGIMTGESELYIAIGHSPTCPTLRNAS
jgi:hypothetical protein